MPSFNAANGYRYYKPEDFFTFMFIAHLTKIGFSLNEVKDFITHQSLDNYINAIKTSEKRLLEKQEKIRLRNERTQRGFEALQKILKQPLNQPHITYRDEEYYLRLPFNGDVSGKSCVTCIAEHNQYAAAQGIDLQRHFLGLYSENPFNENPPVFDSMITKMSKRIECEKLFCRPAGMYISMCYRGPFSDEGKDSYDILNDYLDLHRFTPLTGMFVEAAVGPFYTIDKSEFIAELSVLIE